LFVFLDGNCVVVLVSFSIVLYANAISFVVAEDVPAPTNIAVVNIRTSIADRVVLAVVALFIFYQLHVICISDFEVIADSLI
jgi:hypothetical protein